jgi:hypothetical protein
MASISRKHDRDYARSVMRRLWPDGRYEIAAFDKSNGKPKLNVLDLDAVDFTDEWLVEDLIPARSLVVWSAAFSSGKSAAWNNIATSDTFLGKRVNLGGKVLASLPEARTGMAKRLMALTCEGGESKAEADAKLRERVLIANSPVYYSDPDMVTGLIEAVREHEVTLLVFDTHSRSMIEGDENSASDTNEVLARMHQIIDATGCSILICHHTGHGVQERGRGSSALEQGADSAIISKAHPKRPGVFRLWVTKQREAARMERPLDYRLVGTFPKVVGGAQVTGVEVQLVEEADDVEQLESYTKETVFAQQLVVSLVARGEYTSRKKMLPHYQRRVDERMAQVGSEQGEVSDYALRQILDSMADRYIEKASAKDTYKLTLEGENLYASVENPFDGEEG